jgi:outer membrane protein TolC
MFVSCLLAVQSFLSVAPLYAGEEPPPWQPPTFSYNGNGIALLEAVRLTLEQDPNLLLRSEDVRTQHGRLLEQSGAFDWTLTAQGTYEHRKQELRESTRQGEIDKRNQIRDVQAIACPEASNLTVALQDLEAARTTRGVDIRNDQGFNAQLRIIEAAILAVSDAAQRAALEQTRANLIETEIATNRDAQASAQQVCTESGDALQRLGTVPDEEEFDIARLDVRVDKLTRSGTLLSPFMRGAYDSSQFVGKHQGFITDALDPFGRPLVSPSGIPLTRLISFGGKEIEDVYTTDVGFEVNLPLLRNRGFEATGASERAAEIDYEATRLFLEHAASESVLNTATAYWNLVAAQEQVKALESSVGLQKKMVDIIQALIKADELPGAELPRGQAGEANARAQLASAERDRTSAALELLRAMGLSVDNAGQVPSAADGFPPPPDRAQVEALEAALARRAVDSRLDVRASRTLVESGQVLARAAFLALRPQVDVKLGAWLTARGETTYKNALHHWASRPSWSIKTAIEKPFGNRFARGQLEQGESALAQRQIQATDLERQVRIEVVRSAATLVEAIDQLARADEAASNAQRTIDSEIEKLRLGETTLIDSILTEQQRTSAVLAAIAARFQVATLLAQLRFESGTLVVADEHGPRVAGQAFTALPGNGG